MNSIELQRITISVRKHEIVISYKALTIRTSLSPKVCPNSAFNINSILQMGDTHGILERRRQRERASLFCSLDKISLVLFPVQR